MSTIQKEIVYFKVGRFGMLDWQETTLGEIANINPSAVSAGNPDKVIRYIDISSVDVGALNTPPAIMLMKDAPSRARRLVEYGDSVLSTVRPNRKSRFFVRHDLADTVVSTGFAVLRPKNKNTDARYLYSIICDEKFVSHLIANEKGAAYPAVTTDIIERYPLILPSLQEQKAIAAVLGALDDKIELNRRMNATLEAMARALFKSWFVDFDPVRAKMEGKQPFGMDAATAALFPSCLIPSPLGDIPEGWNIVPVIDSAEFINGAAYKNMHFSDAPDALPVIKIAELKNGISPGTQYTNSDLGEKFRLDTGDILFSWSGSPDTSIDTFIYTGGPARLNQHIFKVVSENNEKRCFTYWLLKYLNPTFIEIARDKQTTGLGHVTRADMQRLKFAEPSEDIVKAFYQKAGALMDAIQSNLSQAEHLAKTRDYLLPKLISGDIRIPDAEKFVEAA